MAKKYFVVKNHKGPKDEHGMHPIVSAGTMVQMDDKAAAGLVKDGILKPHDEIVKEQMAAVAARKETYMKHVKACDEEMAKLQSQLESAPEPEEQPDENGLLPPKKGRR